MRAPAQSLKPPTILIGTWILILGMIAGYSFLNLGYRSFGLVLFALAAIVLVIGSIISIINTVSRRRASYRIE
jgi:hypothetical protein